MTLDQLPPRYREQALRQLNTADGKGRRPFFSSTSSPSPKRASAPSSPSSRPHGKIGPAPLLKAPTPEEAARTERKRRKTLTPDMAGDIVKDVKVSPDGNEVRIVLGINPSSLSTAQQKGAFVGKDGRVHFFTKAKIAKAEKTLVMALSPFAKHSASWGAVPIELCTDFYFPYPSGTPKKQLHKIGPMLAKPDGDNLLKGLADSLTHSNFWQDDSLIANYLIRKRRTTQQPCIVIRIVNLLPRFNALYRETEDHDNPSLFSKDHQPTPSETNPLNDLLKTTTPSPDNSH